MTRPVLLAGLLAFLLGYVATCDYDPRAATGSTGLFACWSLAYSLWGEIADPYLRLLTVAVIVSVGVLLFSLAGWVLV